MYHSMSCDPRHIFYSQGSLKVRRKHLAMWRLMNDKDVRYDKQTNYKTHLTASHGREVDLVFSKQWNFEKKRLSLCNASLLVSSCGDFGLKEQMEIKVLWLLLVWTVTATLARFRGKKVVGQRSLSHHILRYTGSHKDSGVTPGIYSSRPHPLLLMKKRSN